MAGAEGQLEKVEQSQILALPGRHQQSIDQLRRALQEGWRLGWWYYLQQDPNFDTVRNTPEFQSITAELESDIDQQLARVREMEQSGDLAILLRTKD
jgi:hypothetical protein